MCLQFDSPSPREEINFNKWVRVAIVVPRDKISGLQDMNDQVAELLVVVDLKLSKEGQWNLNVCIFHHFGVICFGSDKPRDSKTYSDRIVYSYVTGTSTFTDLYLSRDGVRLGLRSICSLQRIKATCLNTVG